MTRGLYLPLALLAAFCLGALAMFLIEQWVDNRTYTGRWWPWTKTKKGEWR